MNICWGQLTYIKPQRSRYAINHRTEFFGERAYLVTIRTSTHRQHNVKVPPTKKKKKVENWKMYWKTNPKSQRAPSGWGPHCKGRHANLQRQKGKVGLEQSESVAGWWVFIVGDQGCSLGRLSVDRRCRSGDQTWLERKYKQQRGQKIVHGGGTIWHRGRVTDWPRQKRCNVSLLDTGANTVISFVRPSRTVTTPTNGQTKGIKRLAEIKWQLIFQFQMILKKKTVTPQETYYWERIAILFDHSYAPHWVLASSLV